MSVARRWKRVLLSAAILAVGVVGGGAADWARSALAEAQITACLDGSGYFFRAPAGRPCPGDSLTWNQQGPTGPSGPPGAGGPQGPAGPQGSPGTATNGSPLKDGQMKVVKKHLVSPKLSGGDYGFELPYAGPPATLTCPFKWTATSSGFEAGAPDAFLISDRPLSLPSGRVFGWSMQAAVSLFDYKTIGNKYPKYKWDVTFYVICMKLT